MEVSIVLNNQQISLRYKDTQTRARQLKKLWTLEIEVADWIVWVVSDQMKYFWNLTAV